MSEHRSRPGENPLVPNALLRAMYTSMVEVRTLEEQLATARRLPRSGRIRGQEAVRVSTVRSLEDGDLVSNAAGGAAMTMLLAGSLRAHLRGRALAAGPRTLPSPARAETRLSLALGASLALKAQGSKRLVLAYAQADELSGPSWKRLLTDAAQAVAPILLVRSGADIARSLSPGSHRLGIPGILIDASDAIALYRVVQESVTRIRMGGGPVLLEPVTFHLRGKRVRKASTDPLLQLEQTLAKRRVVDAAWCAKVRSSATAQIAGRRRSGRGLEAG